MKGKAPPSSSGAGTGLATTHETASTPIAGSRVTRQTSSRPSLSEMSSPTPSGPVQPEKQSVASKIRRRQSLDSTSDGHLAVPRKRRKTDINTSIELQGTPPVSSSTRSRSLQSIPHLTTKATLNGVHQTPAAKISPGLLTDKAKGITPPIKRIKLIVRAPEPVYTNPKQKPTPPIFNKSVTSALASFTRIEDKDANEDALEEEARGRAVFLERVHALRQQGQMLLSSEDASRARALQTRPTVPRTLGADPWGHILDAVCARYRGQRETSGPEIAASIAAKVRTYWDLQNAKEGRVRLQQEKQLRALAKTTLKLVITEWKKAIFVSDFLST